MMDYVPAIFVAMSLIAFVWMLSAWRTYWVSETREDLFYLRQRLFLYAVDENLVEHDSHQLLRQSVNSMVRYAHELTLARYAALVFGNTVWGGAEKPQRLAEWENAVASLPKAQREVFEAFHMEMGVVIIRQIVKTSISLRTLVALKIIWDWATKGKTKDASKEIARHVPTDLIEQDALLSCKAA